MYSPYARDRGGYRLSKVKKKKKKKKKERKKNYWKNQNHYVLHKFKTKRHTWK